MAQYQKAPQVTRDRLYTDAMQELYGKTTKVLVDSKGSNIINLPLDKLLPAKATEAAIATGAAPAAAQAASTSAANNPSSTDPRSREDLRSRTRETH